jgi:hypothetical protein
MIVIDVKSSSDLPFNHFIVACAEIQPRPYCSQATTNAETHEKQIERTPEGTLGNSAVSEVSSPPRMKMYHLIGDRAMLCGIVLELCKTMYHRNCYSRSRY